MNIVSLSDICDLQNGFAFKSDDYIEHSNTLNCRMSNIRPDGNFDIEYNPKYLPDSYTQKYKDFLLKDGDIVIAMTDMANDPKILGVPTIVDTKGYDLLLNQRVGKLIFHKKDEVDVRFLQYSLNRKSVRKYYTQFAGGGLQLNVGKKEILSVKIPLPPLPQQQKIANILDAADALRQNDKALIAKYDELTQALFLDMFGDPVSNPKGWEKVKLGEATKMKAGKFIAASDIFPENNNDMFSCFGGNGIRGFVNSYTHEGEFVLIGRQGALCGNVKIANGKFHATEHAVVCSPIMKYQTLWLYYLLEMMNLNRFSTGAAQPGLNVGTLVDIEIMMAPFNLQFQFTERVKVIEEQKAIVQKSLEKSEELFNSLLQRAFKGELI